MKTKYKILKLAVRESMQAKDEAEKDHETTKLKMQAQADELIELKARNLNLEDRALLLSDTLDDEQAKVMAHDSVLRNETYEKHIKELMNV